MSLTEFRVGDYVEFIKRIPDDSCGERTGDRGLVVKISENKILVYHLTMERDNGWSLYKRNDSYARLMVTDGILAEEQTRQSRFWWYRDEYVAKIANRKKIEWID